MTRNLLSCRRWFLASHLARSGNWGFVCVLCLTILAWNLKITQHSQQTSKQRIFSKEREKKWQNNTFASNVYICVLVFIINQHNGWKVLIYEIQIKKIHYASMSFLNGRWTRVLALDGAKGKKVCFAKLAEFVKSSAISSIFIKTFWFFLLGRPQSS